jgi:hypothetical protein
MDAERTPRAEEVERYHVQRSWWAPHCCLTCRHWAEVAAKREAEEAMLERMLVPRHRWRRWLQKLPLVAAILLAVAALLAAISPAWAIPACWTVEPRPGAIEPWDSGIFTQTDGCRGFTLTGSDPWGEIHLESMHWMLPAAPLIWTHHWLRSAFPTGPVELLEPDDFMVSWLAGSGSVSDLYYTQSRNTALDEPLTHTPEPSTLVLLASGLGMALVGWRARRGR